MKKFAAALLALTLLLFETPFSSPAAATESGDGVINMRGTRTYIGLASDWAKTWDSSNFEEVTGDDVSWSGNVTVKAGTVDNLNVSGNLTMSGGTVGDTSCSGSAKISDGTLKSIDAGDDITMTGGSVRHDMTSDDGDITLDGTISVGGSITARSEVLFSSGATTISGSVAAIDVTLDASASAKVSGTVEVTGTLLLNKGTFTASKIDGDGVAKIEADGFANQMPTLYDVDSFQVDSDKKVILNQKLSLNALYLESGSEFVNYSPLETDYISGPGALCVDAGELTVHEGVTGTPYLLFNDTVSSGTTAFRADSGAVSEDDLLAYGYNFDEISSGSYDLFRLSTAGSQGVSLNKSSLAVVAGSAVTVSASVSPKFSQYATGTQIIWQLDGDSSAFSLSTSSDEMSCKVSASSTVSGRHKAILTAYLADKDECALSDYRAESCILSTGYTDQDSSISLDTTYVSMLVGNNYGVLAVTGASVAPTATSYNPSVVAVAGTKAVTDKNGNAAWLYTVTGKGNGSTTVDIGGCQMAVTVNSGILMDTMSYSMAPQASYCVGVLTRGVDENSISVSSSSACASVAFYKKGSDGVILYRVTGLQTGSADIVFAVSGGQSVEMSVAVAPGVKSSGKSARLVALKQ